MGSTALGYQAAGVLRQRCSDLASLARGLEVLATEIGYGAVPLGPALERAAAAVGGSVGRLLAAAGNSVAGGSPPGEALQAAITAVGSETGLLPEDQALLLTLTPVLGQSGRSDQLRHLARLQAELSAARTSAQDRATRFEPVCRYGGLLGGLAVWLLLL